MVRREGWKGVGGLVRGECGEGGGGGEGGGLCRLGFGGGVVVGWWCTPLPPSHQPQQNVDLSGAVL